jgi:hypothetical protein
MPVKGPGLMEAIMHMDCTFQSVNLVRGCLPTVTPRGNVWRTKASQWILPIRRSFKLLECRELHTLSGKVPVTVLVLEELNPLSHRIFSSMIR